MNRTAVSWLTFGDTNHYTTEDCCLATFIAVHFLSQLKCSLIKQKAFKNTRNLPGWESNPSLLSDSQRYLPLYYRGLLLNEICCSWSPEPTEMFINNIKILSTADILSHKVNRTAVPWLTFGDTNHYTTEDCCLATFIAVHLLSQLNCSLIKPKSFKNTRNLPGGESNPGLLSDSQRYLPLYYRGLLLNEICCSWSPEPTEMFINNIKSLSTADILSHAVNRTAVSWLTFGDTNHYTTEDCCLATFIAVHFLSQLKCSLIKQKAFKNTRNLPGWESNRSLLSDSQRYLPPYYRRLLLTEICCSWSPEPTEMFINKIKSLSTADILSHAVNRTRCPDWHSEMLTTMLQRISV